MIEVSLTPEQVYVIDWIKSNPHAAMEIALSAHNHGWYGCQCQLQTEIDKRVISGAKILQPSETYKAII